LIVEVSNGQSRGKVKEKSGEWQSRRLPLVFFPPGSEFAPPLNGGATSQPKRISLQGFGSGQESTRLFGDHCCGANGNIVLSHFCAPQGDGGRIVPFSGTKEFSRD